MKPTTQAIPVVQQLALHRAHVPRVAAWLRAEWPRWYGPDGQGDALADATAFAASGGLPVGFLALIDGEPCGVAALKATSIATHRHLSPWASAGYVVPSRRHQGIGAALLGALEQSAHALGYATIYCATATSASLLRRGGWREMERVQEDGHELVIFSKTL